jgi:Domain of unknown function (DUF3331)
MLNAESLARSFELLSRTVGARRSNSWQSAHVETPARTSVIPSPRLSRSGRRSHSRHAIAFTGDDPWSRTLAGILHFSDPAGDRPYRHIRASYRPVQGAPTVRDSPTVTIAVLEKLANSLVALSWHDPTRCNYEEQIWFPSLARRSGQCALSGVLIKKGDPVYRPRARGGVVPLNAAAMILNTAIKNAMKFNAS